MARGRMLNNKISASRQMNDLLPNDTCRLLATWLVAHLDKNGVFYGEPVMVKSYVFPRRADVSIGDVETYLLAMEEAELIIRFEANGDRWLYWPSFAENQIGLRADRESTTFPSPPTLEDEQPAEQPAQEAEPDPIDSLLDAGSLPDDCRKDDGQHPAQEKLREEKIKVSKDKTMRPAHAGGSLPDESRAPPGLTEGQRLWLDSFNAKRFANNVQKNAVYALEERHGLDVFTEGVKWAAKRGLSMGQAVTSLESALPKWGKPKGQAPEVVQVSGL